ncbi:MAG: DNA polymerase III subunit delta [Candidatus Krumholzibacteria bacterium]|nr:DNA polymerase III subunit delta [Candidatus Krumholzibacteria bacterium]
MKTGLSFYKKIFSDIDAGDLAPLYLLSGEERYIMEEMGVRIRAAALGNDCDFNFDMEYGSEIDIERFVSTANSYPFMGEKRVLFIKELEKLKGKWKQLLEYCSNPAMTSIVIMFFNTHDESGKKIRSGKDYSKLEKIVGGKGRHLRFDKLKQEDLKKWICTKAARSGVTLSLETADSLIESVGSDLYNIQNELDKVFLVFEGKDITEKSIGKVIGRYRLNAVYDLIESIRPGKENLVLSVLSNIISSGAERPSTLLYLVTRHFLSLLKIKAGGGGGGYYFDRIKKTASLFTTREIIVWLENIRVADLTIKSTSFPEKLLLESVFIHSMNGKYMDLSAGAVGTV